MSTVSIGPAHVVAFVLLLLLGLIPPLPAQLRTHPVGDLPDDASLRLMLRKYRGEGGSRGARADLYLGGMLAVLAFNVAGLFENNWGDTEVQRVMLFVLAIPFCLSAPETHPEPDASSGAAP